MERPSLNQDGKDFNVVLQALLIDGKIVLREPQEDDRTKTADTKKDMSPTFAAPKNDAEDSDSSLNFRTQPCGPRSELSPANQGGAFPSN